MRQEKNRLIRFRKFLSQGAGLGYKRRFIDLNEHCFPSQRNAHKDLRAEKLPCETGMGDHCKQTGAGQQRCDNLPKPRSVDGEGNRSKSQHRGCVTKMHEVWP